MTDIEAIIAACERWANDYEQDAAMAPRGKRVSPTYARARVIAYRNIANMIRERSYWAILDMDDPSKPAGQDLAGLT